MNPERKRQSLALLVSLLVHALLLSLIVSGQGLGLPGFSLPWQARRAEAPALRVVLLAPQSPAAPQPVQQATTLTLPLPSEPMLPAPSIEAPTSIAPEASTAAFTTAAPTAMRIEPRADTAPLPAPKPAVIAVPRLDEAAWLVPPAPALIASAPSAPSLSSPDTALTNAPDQTAEIAALERTRQAAEQRRAEQQARQQEALQAAAQQAAARQEAARVEAARLETERQEAARQNAARQAAAAQQEAARQEAARQASLRQDSEREAAEQAAAARQEAARQEAARSETARLAAARLAEAQAAAESREAKLRAIGRQLNEEADRRDAAAAAAARQSPSALPASLSTARRGRLFGRTDANAELVVYAEAWSRKIQLNMGFDMVREAAKQPHTDPLVTVAIRSDGSVESVSFVRSSGVAAIDEAIRRIVLSQANYPAFQPALAREYDVVEIRRTWHFDMAIRLY
jgi:hypothetical protein